MPSINFNVACNLIKIILIYNYIEQYDEKYDFLLKLNVVKYLHEEGKQKISSKLEFFIYKFKCVEIERKI